MPTQRRTAVWADANGKTTAHLLTTTVNADPLEASIAAHSNAAVQEKWSGDLIVVAAPAPVAATYQSVKDVAVLMYQTASGHLVKLSIPAPHAGIFQADSETVDPAAVSSITTAALLYLVDINGNAVVGYVAGSRWKRP